MSSMSSGWRPVTGVLPQGMLLSSVLFNHFVNYLDDRTGCALSKPADGTKLEGVAVTLV